ncbi:apolipoprotein N-acyltransferase [Metallococcus carri]|uniref:apolipoprotein N-acyltransferase n=1 Tax=Metallococcus carri TaxID=1656884 RepID=UPI002E2B66C1|nr:apolipoprotein N-acyltransferase [Metallococcus carri]
MIVRLAAAALGGLALWLSFPDTAWWPLAPVGVALLALATRGVRTRAGLLLGFVAGLTYFLPVLHWSGIYVGNLPWIALGVTEALYLAAMGAGCAWAQQHDCRGRRLTDARVRPLLIALMWVLQETVRSNWPFGGLPWARLAWSQAGAPLSSLASVAGAPGLTFAVALVGGLLAAAVQALVRTYAARGGFRSTLRPVVVPVAGAVAVFVAALAWPVPTAGKPLQVIGIQGNVPTAGLDFNAQRRAVLDNHAKVTAQATNDIRAGRMPKPDLVVWPENSSDIDPTRNADAATEIIRAVAGIGAPTIVGAVVQEPAPKVSNTSMLYEPGRGLVARYVKQHPVPFAEYMPYRSFFRLFSDKVDLLTTDFTAGKTPGVFRVPTATAGTVGVGPVICFEVAYDGLVRAPVERGAQLIVVQTNNATFGYTAESTQQLGISRIRAIEHGRSVMQISTVGVSALITPDGVPHDTSSLFTAKVLAGQLPLRSTLTLADRWGNRPEIVADLLAVGLLAAPVVVRRSRRRETAARSAH